MRISHKQLEKCEENPSQWLVNASGFLRLSYSYATQLALYRYHKINSEVRATEYLRSLLDRRKLRSQERCDQAEENLHRYVQWFANEKPIVAATRLRVSLDIGHGWILGGEISRIDIDISSGYYRAILLDAASNAWQGQLRMPLLQRAIAQKLERIEQEIAVGVQNLDGSGLQVISFSKWEIERAVNNVRALSGRLSQFLRSAG